MVDIWSDGKRSKVMSAIRAKNTRPELVLRSLLHRHGYRYQLHQKNLPGKPDIVLPKYRTAIFVNGCFWHQHAGCVDGRMPKSRRGYWTPKLRRNIERDRQACKQLKSDGWAVIVVWECEIEKAPLKTVGKIKKTLG